MNITNACSPAEDEGYIAETKKGARSLGPGTRSNGDSDNT